MGNRAQVQSFAEDAVPRSPTTFRFTLMKDVIIQTSCKPVANRTDQLFQNNNDFELLTKALKYTFFFLIKKIAQEIMSNKGGEVIVSF